MINNPTIVGFFYFESIILNKIIMKKEKNKLTPKIKELIKNLTQTISKEQKRVKSSDKQLVDKLKKILDKVKP
tara:strand:- start:2838 stop:3056 length:219 start_codon:yes stop_codon:yes gene_type:complete